MKKVLLMLFLSFGLVASTYTEKWYGRNTNKNGVTFNGVENNSFLKGKNEKVRVSLGIMNNEYSGDITGMGIIALINKFNKDKVSYIDLNVGDFYTTTKVLMVKSDGISFRVNLEDTTDLLREMIKVSENNPKEKIYIKVYDTTDKVILSLESTLVEVRKALEDTENPGDPNF